MRLEALVHNQLLMAQSIFAMADHISQTTGYYLTPITFDKLPAEPRLGMLQCVTDSTVNTRDSVITGGGGFTVLAFYDDTGNWVVK